MSIYHLYFHPTLTVGKHIIFQDNALAFTTLASNTVYHLKMPKKILTWNSSFHWHFYENYHMELITSIEASGLLLITLPLSKRWIPLALVTISDDVYSRIFRIFTLFERCCICCMLLYLSTHPLLFSDYPDASKKTLGNINLKAYFFVLLYDKQTEEGRNKAHGGSIIITLDEVILFRWNPNIHLYFLCTEMAQKHVVKILLVEERYPIGQLMAWLRRNLPWNIPVSTKER